MASFSTTVYRIRKGLLALKRFFRKTVQRLLKLSQAILPHRDLVRIKDLMQSVVLLFQIAGSLIVAIVFMLKVFGGGGLTKFFPYSNTPPTRGDYVCYLSSSEDREHLDASPIKRMPTKAPVIKP